MNNEMTTDNMSNEEVIDTLKGIVFNGFDRTTSKERQALDQAIKVLEQRPQGEWEEYGDYKEDAHYFKCSECFDLVDETSNYCPNCGASMTKEV